MVDTDTGEARLDDPLDRLLSRVRLRAERDPDHVTAVLRAIVDDPVDDAVDDPPEPAPLLLEVAARVNAERLAEDRADFREHACDTAQVQRLLGVSTRQAVERYRRAGRLLGLRMGGTTWHPAWQFDEQGIRDGLPAVLTALREADAGDPITADRVLRRHRDDLGGSLEDLLAKGDVDRVVFLVRDLGGGF